MDIWTFMNDTEGFENALNIAVKFGLLPSKDNKNCLKCGTINGLKLIDKTRAKKIPFEFRCSNRSCRVGVVWGKNTLFDKHPISVTNTLRLIYLWLLKISPQDSADQLGILTSSVEELYEIFREVCAYMIINYTEAIGGPGHTIELSCYQLQTKQDSYDLWVFTGMDRDSGDNFVSHLSNLNCESLWPLIRNYILPGSTVVTPMCKELTEKQNRLKESQLVFVHPDAYPKVNSELNLDGMFSEMQQFVIKEMSSNQINCVELYIYQYLYFQRDIMCNKPASEIFLPFINDVKQVYPGYEKLNRFQQD